VKNTKPAKSTFLASVVRDARLQMDALLGQLRAAAQLVGDVTPAGQAIFREREKKRPWRMRFGGNLARLAANLTLRSAVFRHAVRLSITVAAAEILSRRLETPRAYWLPMTVVLVLKPEFTITFTRGLLRIVGTMVGLLLATTMFHFLPQDIGLEVALVGGFVFLLRWAGPANYGVFGIAVSALIVLLIAIRGGISTGSNSGTGHQHCNRRHAGAGCLCNLADVGAPSSRRGHGASSGGLSRLFFVGR
jgi:uncharacterized membrane protein YccC